MGKGGEYVKLMNFSPRTLIYQNVRVDVQEIQEKSQTYTQTQYKILCNLIRQKKISKQFFSFILSSLFDEITDWKQLNYKQMYELIHVLTFYNYQTETEKERI